MLGSKQQKKDSQNKKWLKPRNIKVLTTLSNLTYFYCVRFGKASLFQKVMV